MESENPSSSNPVSDTQKGQLALIDIINVVRDLTLALNRIYETVILTQVTRCLKTELPKNLKERLDFFQNKRKIIKEFEIDNPEDIIPYVDDNGKDLGGPTDDSERIAHLKYQRENLVKKIEEVDSQLLSYKEILTSALWELNDLMQNCKT